MDSNNCYYWVKLKNDFFADNSPIDFLLAEPNGSEYVVLYIKLCLATANTEGRLESRIGEVIVPYNIEKIQRDMKFFSLDTVRVALELYKRLGLVYVQNDGTLTLVRSGIAVGSESAKREAIKKRDYRERKRLADAEPLPVAMLPGTLEGTNEGTNCPTDIRDKSIDIRDKNKNINNTCASTAKKDYSTEFEEFWKVYPRRIDKGGAYKCYQARLNDGWSPGELREAASAYAIECNRNHTEPKYIKHPSTFMSSTTPFVDYIPEKQDAGPVSDDDNPYAEWKE